MLKRTLRILNFDNAVVKQNNLIAEYKPEVIDLQNFGPRARLWMDKRTEKELAIVLQGLTTDSVNLLGSGDFHHMTYLLLEQIKEPFSLILFDSHPDWDILPPHMGCGSWVTRSFKKENISKIVLLGISSSDISTWHLQSANLASLKDNRLEIYPYLHGPSLAFLKGVPENISITAKKGLFYRKIYWQELVNMNLESFVFSLLRRLPTKKVYLSLDKDCLRKEYSLTNWEEGMLGLDELLMMLKIMRDNLEIIGADIVGDYSPISISSKVKNFFSRLDHPKEIPAADTPESFITAINEATNLKLLEILL